MSPAQLPVDRRTSVFRSGVYRDRTMWGLLWGWILSLCVTPSYTNTYKSGTTSPAANALPLAEHGSEALYLVSRAYFGSRSFGPIPCLRPLTS